MYSVQYNSDPVILTHMSETGKWDFWGVEDRFGFMLRALFFHACRASGHVLVSENSKVPPEYFEAHATFTLVCRSTSVWHLGEFRFSFLIFQSCLWRKI